jgi:hypothetical protein
MRLYSTLYALDSRDISIGGSRTIGIVIKGGIDLVKEGEEVRGIRGPRAAIINLGGGRTKGGRGRLGS